MAFVRTSSYRENDKHYGAYRSIPIHSLSSDTARLNEVACAIVRQIYHPGHKYAEVGVMMMDLQSDTAELCLVLGSEEPETRTCIMTELDYFN